MLPGVEGCACEDLSASVVVGVLPRAHKTPRFQKITKKKITLFMSFTDLLKSDLGSGSRSVFIRHLALFSSCSCLRVISWIVRFSRPSKRSTKLHESSPKKFKEMTN